MLINLFIITGQLLRCPLVADVGDYESNESDAAVDALCRMCASIISS